MMNQMNKTSDSAKEEFILDGLAEPTEQFSLEAEVVKTEPQQQPIQDSLILNTEDPERPETSAQIDLAGMDKPVHMVSIHNGAEQAQAVPFQHAHTLLESLEAQDVPVHYQCREGYCGSCRTQLLEGEVHYTEEPMAWINDDEILPCCCIPKTAIRIKLP
jgi:ferredoxin